MARESLAYSKLAQPTPAQLLTCALYVPTEQFTGASLGSLQAWPASHSVQPVSPSKEYEPGAQGTGGWVAFSHL